MHECLCPCVNQPAPHRNAPDCCSLYDLSQDRSAMKPMQWGYVIILLRKKNWVRFDPWSFPRKQFIISAKEDLSGVTISLSSSGKIPFHIHLRKKLLYWEVLTRWHHWSSPTGISRWRPGAAMGMCQRWENPVQKSTPLGPDFPPGVFLLQLLLWLFGWLEHVKGEHSHHWSQDINFWCWSTGWEGICMPPSVPSMAAWPGTRVCQIWDSSLDISSLKFTDNSRLWLAQCHKRMAGNLVLKSFEILPWDSGIITAPSHVNETNFFFKNPSVNPSDSIWGSKLLYIPLCFF